VETSALRAGYLAEQRDSARSTALLAGVVAIVVFPLWTVFDRIVLPHGARFIGPRIGFEIAIVMAWMVLRSNRIGRRWPEQAAFVLVALPEIAISWMLPRTGDHIEPYLLGLSIAIYASAFVIVWRWHLTALLVVVTGLLVALFCVQAGDPFTAAQIATSVFYLGTAGAISIVGQIYRHRTGWLKYVTEAELGEERQRNAVLVEELNQLSRQDPLTGIGNRRAWEERVVAEMLRTERDPVRPRRVQGRQRHPRTRSRRSGPPRGCRPSPRSGTCDGFRGSLRRRRVLCALPGHDARCGGSPR